MIYYVNIFVTSYLMKLVCKTNIYNKRKGKAWIILASAIPILLLSLRDYSVGTDTYSYYLTHEYIFNYGQIYSGIEFFSYLCDWIGHLVFNDFRGVLFIYAIIAIIPAFCFIYDNADKMDPFLMTMFYLTFYYPLTFNTIRQAMAISIILYCYKYLETHKYRHYIVGVLIAILFHTSAITALAVLVFYLLSKKGKILKLIGLLSCVGIQFVIGSFLKWAQSLSVFARYASNYRIHLPESSKIFSYFLSSTTRYLPVLIALFFVIGHMFFVPDSKRESNYDDNDIKSQFFNPYVITCMTIFFVSSITYSLYSTYLVRIGEYFTISVIYLFNYFSKIVRKRIVIKQSERVVSISLNVIYEIYFLLYFWYLFIYLEYDSIFPYRWFWN